MLKTHFSTKKVWGLICALLCRGLKQFLTSRERKWQIVWFVPCYVGDWNFRINYKMSSVPVWFVPCYVGDWNQSGGKPGKPSNRLICALLKNAQELYIKHMRTKLFTLFFEPWLHWRRWIRWIKTLLIHLFHLLQCNHGSKTEWAIIKWVFFRLSYVRD